MKAYIVSNKFPWGYCLGVLAMLVIMMLLFISIANASEPININALANAIYKAEGGAKTSHPYGILAHYKHTTPREACINTIKHALKDFDGKGDFIRFLQKRYCPIGASNDPKGLNKNWYANVTKFYAKEIAK
jgi:hypothetical protein